MYNVYLLVHLTYVLSLYLIFLYKEKMKCILIHEHERKHFGMVVILLVIL